MRPSGCFPPHSLAVLQLSLASGERRTEVFIHSLEMGHTAGTRAVKAMGERENDAPVQPIGAKTEASVRPEGL